MIRLLPSLIALTLAASIFAEMPSESESLRDRAFRAYNEKNFNEAGRNFERFFSSELKKKKPLSEDSFLAIKIFFDIYLFDMHDLDKAETLMKRLSKVPGLTLGQKNSISNELNFVAQARQLNRDRKKRGDAALTKKLLNLFKTNRSDPVGLKQSFQLAAFFIPSLPRPAKAEDCCWLELRYQEAAIELRLPDADLEPFVAILNSYPKNACTIAAYQLFKHCLVEMFPRGGYPKSFGEALEKHRGLEFDD